MSRRRTTAPARRVAFCGAITGFVTLRPGETPEEAVGRAERRLLDLMQRSARTLGDSSGYGPNIGLELDGNDGTERTRHAS